MQSDSPARGPPHILLRSSIQLLLPHVFAVPVLVLWVGLWKKKTKNFGCEKIFLAGRLIVSRIFFSGFQVL
jgi:hypothetical protein